ncbi:MAG: sensor histidine kinase N-terminal domain-containing protein [Sutterellaceae bacterium]|nr:sensor histidine kinase N-terminal domain-containing protein [Burkholderiaceae bacterium]MCX7901288.1 sensor histidine kinase N-terminal domain-containing protein [Burkholderiaceae bacterium]MDW8429176.1 sensor histidine kinase N-terminal domain-containing protein [Sutterellaceae bacterium]
MPDETRSQRPPSHGWRANVRALAAALRTAGRYRSEELPPATVPNPLRPYGERRSLFSEMLDWMWAPLMLVWPLSVTITFLVAQGIADAPHDRALAAGLKALASYVRIDARGVTLELPLPAEELIRADAADQTYYMVLGLRGEFIAGDLNVPLPPEAEPPQLGRVRFRFDRLYGEEVRIAYTWLPVPEAPTGAQPVLVQVAETLEKRAQLANEIVRGVIIPQFIILPIAVTLVWLGLTQGLKPLTALRETIRRRRPDDLSPIDPRAAPEELEPLLNSFNELLQRMQQNLAAQRRFIADAAHQMKTPLAGLRTQAELALRQSDAGELRRSLRQIAEATERATHLINQLLALARAEHQATDLAAFTAVDLAQLARETLQDFVPLAVARGIDLGLEAEPAGDIVGLPLQLRELLRNLVDNALRYTPAGGGVTVRIRGGAGCTVLEVEDTGCGIPEAERPLVFERFYRVLGSRSEGSGLGLAIVREIVQQHDARISLSNNPHARDLDFPGTLVRVEFPHLAQPTPALHVRAGSPLPPRAAH